MPTAAPTVAPTPAPTAPCTASGGFLDGAVFWIFSRLVLGCIDAVFYNYRKECIFSGRFSEILDHSLCKDRKRKTRAKLEGTITDCPRKMS